MALFDFLKKKENNEITQVKFSELNAITPIFTAFGKDYMKSETFQICVNTNGSYASKLKIRSIRETDNGKIEDYPELDYLLQVRPNITMCAATFWERVRSFYDIYNNSFIWIERDKQRNIKALWSIDPSTAQFGKSKANDEWFVKFTLSGKTIVVPYSDVIHISKNVLNNELWGDNNTAILNVLNLINVNYQGIENSIKTSGIIRFLGEVATKMSDAELKKRARAFTKNYLGISKNDPVGVAFVDSMVKLTQLDTSKQKTVNVLEQQELDAKVYKFMGVPEKVASGEANEDEIVAYIERTIEPFMQKLEQEMTAKIFTMREIGYKNKIQVIYDKLENMTMKTKLEFVEKTRELGLITLGYYGDLLGVPVPKERRNEIMISQNYIDGMMAQANLKPKEDAQQENKQTSDEQNVENENIENN